MPEDASEDKSLISMSVSDFTKKVTPVNVKDGNELFLFKCAGCGGLHFRHAGYVEMVMPYMRADKTKNVSTDSYSVKVCVACRKCYIWVNDQVYDITEHIDLKAWAVGPGGNC